MNMRVIVGLGETGFSCAQYLLRENLPFVVMDTRTHPPKLAQLRALAPQLTIITGGLAENYLVQAQEIILSPGVNPDHPLLQRCARAGIPLIGDIELFARINTAPVIAVTGTNGKSTVTTLVGQMCRQAGLRTLIAGNIGVPVLTALTAGTPDIAVLELSSYQLVTVYSLKKRAAIVLNVAPDHLERHQTFENYRRAKLRIYDDCERGVVSRDEPAVFDYKPPATYQIVTAGVPSVGEVGIIDGYITYSHQRLIALQELPLRGAHHEANYVAAFGLGHAAGLPWEAMLAAAVAFQGLPHRCQLIRDYQGIYWVNDSKGTNIHATLAAIASMDRARPLILILGGLAKDDDFSPLVPAVRERVKALVVLGQAKPLLIKTFGHVVPVYPVVTLAEAVAQAYRLASAGDTVLLSPACASLDMFDSFEHRGRLFESEVNAL